MLCLKQECMFHVTGHAGHVSGSQAIDCLIIGRLVELVRNQARTMSFLLKTHKKLLCRSRDNFTKVKENSSLKKSILS